MRWFRSSRLLLGIWLEFLSGKFSRSLIRSPLLIAGALPSLAVFIEPQRAQLSLCIAVFGSIFGEWAAPSPSGISAAICTSLIRFLRQLHFRPSHLHHLPFLILIIFKSPVAKLKYSSHSSLAIAFLGCSAALLDLDFSTAKMAARSALGKINSSFSCLFHLFFAGVRRLRVSRSSFHPAVFLVKCRLGLCLRLDQIRFLIGSRLLATVKG